MTKKELISKLTSRKFIISVISIISGLLLLFGFDCNTTETISSVLMIILPTVAYCISEGKVDLEKIKSVSSSVNNTINSQSISTENNNCINEVKHNDEG